MVNLLLCRLKSAVYPLIYFGNVTPSATLRTGLSDRQERKVPTALLDRGAMGMLHSAARIRRRRIDKAGVAGHVNGDGFVGVAVAVQIKGIGGHGVIVTRVYGRAAGLQAQVIVGVPLMPSGPSASMNRGSSVMMLPV